MQRPREFLSAFLHIVRRNCIKFCEKKKSGVIFLEYCLNKNMYTFQKTTYCQCFEEQIEATANLSETMASVAKILKVTCEATVNSENLSGQTLSIEGNACVYVIYITDSGRICGHTEQIPFAKNVELDAVYENSNVDVTAQCNFINARALSGRKLEIKGAVSLKICISCNNDTELILGCDSNKLQLKKSKTNATVFVGRADKNIIIEEELQVSEKPVYSCLKTSVIPKVSECKIVSGKIMVKGEAYIKMLLADEDACLQEFSTVIPFSQMLEVENIADDCSCNATVKLCGAQFKSRTGSDGSFSNVIFTAKLSIAAELTAQRDIEYAEDAYSICDNIELKKQKIDLYSNKGELCDTFNISRELSFSEGDLRSVKSIWAEIGKTNCVSEDGFVSIIGTIKVCILGCNIEGQPVYHERPVDLEYSTELFTGESTLCEPTVKIENCGYSFLGDDCLEVKISLNVCGRVCESKTAELITDITTVDEVLSNRDTCFIIYFAQKGECVWDIAKKYRSTVDGICSVNSIEDGTLDVDTKLIIPQ